MKSKKEQTIKKVAGTYSVEQLYHFNCGVCKKWWAIGDVPKNKLKTLFCPWCGTKQNMVKFSNNIKK